MRAGGGWGSPQPVRPGPPANVSTEAAVLRPGPLRAPCSRSSHSAGRPACTLGPSRSLFPPSLAHKQDGGCCFLPLPNPPYRIAVAAAAGNEPRWGGRVRQRGAGPGLRGGAEAGPRSRSSHNGGSGAGGGADSNHGIRPRAQRGRRFRKLPRRHSVAPFKGEVLKEGGREGGLRPYFQSVDIYGRRCLGWVSALKAVGAQALLRERAKTRSERPSFAPAG